MDQNKVDIDDLAQDVDFSMGEGFERQRAEAAALIDALDRKKAARTMAVPTDDKQVKARLREMGEPAILFGEGPGDRRDRLKYVLQQIQVARAGSMEVDEEDTDDEDEDDEEKEEEFYTPGSDDLLKARRKIAEFSLARARRRIARQREEAAVPLSRIVEVRKQVYGQLKGFTQLGSQIGDERPIAQVRYSPNSKLLLTGSWTGNARLWDMPNCTLRSTMRGHADRVGGVAWHPQATLSQSEEAVNFATGAADGLVKIWSLASEKSLATFEGHEGRVCRIAFHPSGNYIGSASYDGTWRLWDVEKKKQLLLQEGHSKEVFALAFQDDGALVASGGFDAIGRVWDVRTGRTAMVLDGHIREILSLDFAPNGYQVAAGSGDDSIRIWDLRALKVAHSIPAHKSSVSDVRWFRSQEDMQFTAAPTNTNKKEDVDMNGDAEDKAKIASISKSGLYLASSGFDHTVKIWSADDWQLINSLKTDEGKVMSVDIASDGKYIASGSYSRSFHLFTNENAL